MPKVENLPVVLVLCSALFGAFLLVEAGQTSQWPPEVNRTVEQALELANQTYSVRAREYRGGSVEKVSEIARQFDQTLDKLATQLDKTRCEQLRNSEEQEIHRKLATIACDKFNRQRPYEEIARIYLKGVDNPQAVFPQSPPLRDEHANETYRLPWEYFLLSPTPAGTSPKFDFRAADALGRIGNNSSITTLIYCYRITTHKDADTQSAKQRQHLILRALNYFTNEQALRAMLECLSLSEQQEKETGKALWDVKGYVYRLLSDQENYRNGELWRKVITDFPKAGLPPHQRELLERALSALKNSRT